MIVVLTKVRVFFLCRYISFVTSRSTPSSDAFTTFSKTPVPFINEIKFYRDLGLLVTATTHGDLNDEKQQDRPPIPVRLSALARRLRLSINSLLEKSFFFNTTLGLALLVDDNGLVEMRLRALVCRQQFNVQRIRLGTFLVRSSFLPLDGSIGSLGHRVEAHMPHLPLGVQMQPERLLPVASKQARRRHNTAPNVLVPDLASVEAELDDVVAGEGRGLAWCRGDEERRRVVIVDCAVQGRVRVDDLGQLLVVREVRVLVQRLRPDADFVCLGCCGQRGLRSVGGC